MSDHCEGLREALREAILERDEMRRANVTPEDADRPLGQSVEYWQDRALDHATTLDRIRVENAHLREALQELADNKHGFRRPAGAIAKAALEGRPLPGWE